MDLNPHLKLGWSPLHDACFKGNTPVISKLVSYGKENGKNLIELETSDEYKTTPLIIAALGGRIEVVQLLIENGANINATIQIQTNRIHLNIIEVATIRKDIDLLIFLYDNNIPNICKNIRGLMISEKIDAKGLEACAEVIEIFSRQFHSFKNTPLKKNELELHSNNKSFTSLQRLTMDLIGHKTFGKCLSVFLELCDGNIQCIMSFTKIFSNVSGDFDIRKQFCENNGIDNLIKYVDKQMVSLAKKIKTEVCKGAKLNKSQVMESKKMISLNYAQSLKSSTRLNSFDSLSDIDDADNFVANSNEDVWCMCIGKIAAKLSSFPDCLEVINSVDHVYYEKIIKYIHCLFEWNQLIIKVEARKKDHATDRSDNSKLISLQESLVSQTKTEISENLSQSAQFEQYIHAYLICLGNLTLKNKVNKRLFNTLNLMENLLHYWNHIKTIKPLHYLTNIPPLETFPDLFEHVTVQLVNNLKLAVIETLGKTLNKNEKLKRIYLYSYKQTSVESSSNESSAGWFIRECIQWLESSVDHSSRLFQYEVLKFIKLICDGDPVMQGILLPHCSGQIESRLIDCLRNLMRKNAPANMRHTALLILWILSGEENEYQEHHDRKCAIYRMVNPEELIDLLFESGNEVTLICLEALLSILLAPPHRNSEGEIVNAQDELAKIHLIPAILRLLKSTNSTEEIRRVSLRVLESLCISYGYKNNSKNQLLISKNGGLPILNDFIKNPSISQSFKCQVYYTLSMISLSNVKMREELFKLIQPVVMIKEVRKILVTPIFEINNMKRHEILNEEIDAIDQKVTAGLVVCCLCYQNEDFIRKMISHFEKVNMDVYKLLLDNLKFLIEKSVFNNDKKNNFLLQKFRCFLSFQIAAMHNFIQHLPEEDPRALGIKIMTDMLPNINNSYLRAIICDYIGRLVSINASLSDPFICMDVIEILARSTFDDDKSEVKKIRGDTEKGCAAISLGFFLNKSPEARRRFFKMARKNENVMKILKYSNKSIHPDLMEEWTHFKTLDRVIGVEFGNYYKVQKKEN